MEGPRPVWKDELRMVEGAMFAGTDTLNAEVGQKVVDSITLSSLHHAGIRKPISYYKCDVIKIIIYLALHGS